MQLGSDLTFENPFFTERANETSERCFTLMNSAEYAPSWEKSIFTEKGMSSSISDKSSVDEVSTVGIVA